MPTAFGLDIPNRDALSGLEVERLEEIYQRDTSGARKRAEIAALFHKTRNGKTVTVDDLLEEPYDAESEAAIEELVAPFLRVLDDRAVRAAPGQLTSMSPDELRTYGLRIQEAYDRAEVLLEMVTEEQNSRSEVGGNEPKAS